MNHEATDPRVYVSFVHGFEDGAAEPVDEPVAALWELQGDSHQYHQYVFPFDADDFKRLPYPICGQMPRNNENIDKRPRYGFTGLEQAGNSLFAGSWNGIYRLGESSKEVESFISNRFTCYLHRFHVDDDRIVVAVPFNDTVVIMNHEGEVLDRFRIDRHLRITRQFADDEIDWRFVAKPWSGSTGSFHFNNVQVIEGQIYLTARNLSCFVVVDLEKNECYLRTMNHRTPVCVHDGDHVDGKFYFTSIDGKVLVASEAPDYDESIFSYDLLVDNHRLDAVENNWCRGIAVTPDDIYVTIDGRYGTDLSFKLLRLSRQFDVKDQHRFEWSNVGDEAAIRYVTGFDIVVDRRSA